MYNLYKLEWHWKQLVGTNQTLWDMYVHEWICAVIKGMCFLMNIQNVSWTIVYKSWSFAVQIWSFMNSYEFIIIFINQGCRWTIMIWLQLVIIIDNSSWHITNQIRQLFFLLLAVIYYKCSCPSKSRNDKTQTGKEATQRRGRHETIHIDQEPYSLPIANHTKPTHKYTNDNWIHPLPTTTYPVWYATYSPTIWNGTGIFLAEPSCVFFGLSI